MYKCFSITKAVWLSKTSFPCWFWIKQNMKWNTYQDFCSALGNFCLRHCSFPLNTLRTTRPNCYGLSCFPASQVFCISLSSFSPSTDSLWWFILNPKPCKDCQCVHIPIPPSSGLTRLYLPVNALHSANTVCLARRIMRPGNHSSQPWLSSLLAQKKIVMTSLPQPGPKSVCGQSVPTETALLRLHEVLLKSHTTHGLHTSFWSPALVWVVCSYFRITLFPPQCSHFSDCLCSLLKSRAATRSLILCTKYNQTQHLLL